MKNLLFVISTLNEGGGAARVLCTLANHFSDLEDYSISVLTHTDGTVFKLNDKINHKILYNSFEIKNSIINKIFRRINYFPRLIKSILNIGPNNVVVLLRGMNWRLILVCKILNIRVIACEHTNHLAEQGIFSWIERNLIYRISNDLVVLTKFDWLYYKRYIKNVHVIPNPLSMEPTCTENVRNKTILLAGDLNRWHIKGFDNAIYLFSKIHFLAPQWKLVIAGGGNEGEKYLYNLIKFYKMENFIELIGMRHDLNKVMETSEIFLLTSRYEGFSLVLLEAMSQGCACVSFNCKAGPSDLLINGFSGYLVDDQNIYDMEHVLLKLINNPNIRNFLSMNAINESKKYTTEEISKHWIYLLENPNE